MRFESSYRSFAFLAVVLGLLAGSLTPGVGAAAKPATHAVSIEATNYKPGILSVKVGDTIVWTNNDPFPHTVTSEAGGFDSHEIQAGKSWKYVARKKGNFPYICTLHPTMKGTLQVK